MYNYHQIYAIKIIPTILTKHIQQQFNALNYPQNCTLSIQQVNIIHKWIPISNYLHSHQHTCSTIQTMHIHNSIIWTIFSSSTCIQQSHTRIHATKATHSNQSQHTLISKSNNVFFRQKATNNYNDPTQLLTMYIWHKSSTFIYQSPTQPKIYQSHVFQTVKQTKIERFPKPHLNKILYCSLT